MASTRQNRFGRFLGAVPMRTRHGLETQQGPASRCGAVGDAEVRFEDASPPITDAEFGARTAYGPMAGDR
jgi:hypothetical protein